jgi:peptide/nickel transport system permease protein
MRKGEPGEMAGVRFIVDSTRGGEKWKAGRSFLRRYRKNRMATVGLLFFIPAVFVALLSRSLAPFDPMTIVASAFLSPDPNSRYVLGTDNLGRDILSRLVYGVGTSLLVGFTVVAVSASIGILVGSISGYFGGRIDDVLSRMAEVFQVVPSFFLALVLLVVMGPGIGTVVLVLGILTWPSTARLLRAEYLSLREREFVEAARSVGVNDFAIIFGEILPNAIYPVIINSSLEVPRAILLEASLSFMGVGDPVVVSLGAMLQKAMPYLREAWWMAFFPGFVLFILVMSINLIGDGLNDALNPKLKER